MHKKHKKAPKAQKSTKEHKKAQKRNQKKAQNANERTKIKNVLKKHLRGKKYICVFVPAKKKNRRVSTMEMLVPLN